MLTVRHRHRHTHKQRNTYVKRNAAQLLSQPFAMGPAAATSTVITACMVFLMLS